MVQILRKSQNDYHQHSAWVLPHVKKKKKKKRTGLSYSNGCCLNSFKLRGDQVAGVHAGCKDGGVQLLASCFPRGTFFCESGDAGGRYGTQRREAIVDMKAYCLQGKFNTFLCCRLLTFIELDSSLGSFTATPPADTVHSHTSELQMSTICGRVPPSNQDHM